MSFATPLLAQPAPAGTLEQTANAQRADATVAVTPDVWLRAASKTLLATVDPVNGGFGSPRSGSKSPQVPALDALLAAATRARDPGAEAALLAALDAMAYGGIHDHIGGGFHRGAIDPTWTIPRFEKRLSDNAQLLSLYVGTYPPTRQGYLRDVVIDIATYLLRDMQAPDGGFYTSQGAVADGLDGRTYLWTRVGLEQELDTRDTARLLAVYDLVPLPNAPRNAGGVLRVRLPIDDTVRTIGATDSVSMLNAVANIRADLLELRMDRPQPPIDKTVVTSFNGLTIAALAQAGVEVNRADFIDAAQKAANTLWAEAYDPANHLVKHAIVDGRAEGDGALSDYAMLADSFLDLADATQDDAWRERATKLADAMLQRFAQADGALSRGDADADTDMPSGTSSALDLLAQLGTSPGGMRFQTAAARLATAVSGTIAAHPSAWPSAVAALARHPIPVEALAAAAPGATFEAYAPAGPASSATADHVHVSAKLEGDRIVVTLKVDPGYRVTAHKASLKVLVPTALSIVLPRPTAVDYPAAIRIKSALAPTGLDVYEGEVALVARFPAGALSGLTGIGGRLTTQACDARTCLPPADLFVTVADQR